MKKCIRWKAKGKLSRSILQNLYINGSQFILKPTARPEGKIIFAPLAPFDVLYKFI